MTKDNTALAFANGLRASILIPAIIKRTCIRSLRRRGITGPALYNQLFAVGLFLLLRDHINKLSSVILDYEYVGRENKIKEHLINLLRRDGYTIAADQIQYLHIGKKSPAHELAIATLRGDKEPSRKIKYEEILKRIQAIKNRGLSLDRNT